jgi:hypothetical protein
MKFSNDSVNEIVNCFIKHDVQISSQDVKNIPKAVNEIIPKCASIFRDENKYTMFNYKTAEYSISNKKLLSYKTWYPYGLVQLLANTKIKNHLIGIQNNLLDFKIGVFSIRESYSVVSTKSDDIIDSFTYILSTGNLIGVSEKSFLSFLKILDLPLFLNEIRKDVHSNLWLFSIDIDYQNSISAVSFGMNIKDILNSNFSNYAKNCENIDEIMKFMMIDFSDGDMGTLGFDIKNKSFFIELYPNDYEEFENRIKSHLALNYEYINSLQFEGHKNHGFKLRWNNKKKFMPTITKIYENPYNT